MTKNKAVSNPNIERKNFKLDKMNYKSKDGVLEVHYTEMQVLNEAVYQVDVHKKYTQEIHPDLKKCLLRLRPIVGRIFLLTSFQSVVGSKDFKASTEQQKQSDAMFQSIIDAIDTRGISLSGDGDKVAVIITSVYTVIGNLCSCLNTPRIKMHEDKFGFEEELLDIATDIENEIYEYIYNGKKAQQEMYDPKNGYVPHEYEKEDEEDNSNE